MHLLYLDDSGAVQNRSDRHIILAGISVFERQTHWLSGSLDKVAERVWPDNPTIEFHATEMFTGKRQWRGVEKDVRAKAYCDALRILAVNQHVRLFGAAIHRKGVGLDDPMEFAFEAMASRFDCMLGRMHKVGDTQRVLIILDKSSYETSLQALALKFRTDGYRWGMLRNLAETTLFVDSAATRMIQYAENQQSTPTFRARTSSVSPRSRKTMPTATCLATACIQAVRATARKPPTSRRRQRLPSLHAPASLGAGALGLP